MNKLSFDPAVNLDLYFRKGRNSARVLRFKNTDGTPYDVSANTFEFISGFTVVVTIDEDEITITIADTQVPTRDSYFWQLKNTSTGQTWFTGTAYFTDGLSAEQDNTEEIIMQLAGDVVEVTIDSPVVVSSGSYRGLFSTPDVFPSAAVVAGDEWATSVISILDGQSWPVKTLLKALEDAPGQDPTKWRIT